MHTMQDSDGYTPLHLAASYGCTTILQALVDAAPPTALEKTEGIFGCTTLMVAARHGQVEALQVRPCSGQEGLLIGEAVG